MTVINHITWAEQKQEAFSELDTKIASQLAKGQWNTASITFVHVLWQDYINAHLNTDGDTVVNSIKGKLPDVTNPDVYIGNYRAIFNGQEKFLKISKSDAGRFFVELEGHRIPAVLKNGCVIFTTGDIVNSEIPSLADKPYCKLEMYIVLSTGGRFYLTLLDAPANEWLEIVKTEASYDNSSINTSKFNNQMKKELTQGITSLKSIVDNFQEKDFRNYELHSVIRDLIEQIDEPEMINFLKQRGIPLIPEKILTSENLIAYLQYKNLGTQAAYAWLDLTKGNPEFVKAATDWQIIQKERGYEFVPTYYLLLKAKLVTQKDKDVWLNIFEHTFTSLDNNEYKYLLLFSLMMKLGEELKDIEPSPAERFAFLTEELKKQDDISKPYSQALLLTLFGAEFFSRHFTEASKLAKDLLPRSTGLFFSFITQIFSRDIDAAAATLSEIEKETPDDKEKIDLYRETLRELKEMEYKKDPNNAPQIE
jgi:hypothetical protein